VYQTVGFAIGIGTVVALVSLMRSAAENMRRANEALGVSEQKFRGLLEAAPDAIVIVDANHRIALANVQAERLLGYRRAELPGQPADMLIADESKEKYAAHLGAFTSDPLLEPTGRTIDLYGLHKNGTTLPIEASLSLLKTEAGILVFNAIRDMTTRKQIEASLAQASKAKSDFLANMSHELRTPLNAIIGFSEMIRDAVIGPLDARYREYGGDISDSGRHLQSIINDILDISKVESGRLVLHDDIVSIGEITDACSRLVVPMAETAGIALSVEAPGPLPLIRVDQVRFQQILLNLMSNAVKFTPAGGRVTVSASLEPGGLVMAVKDTGIGMKAEDIATALEPFRQIEGPLSRRFDGTGLGLPLAKALVEQHGGRLEIESVPGAGTTVRVRLPLERIASAAAA
jgi:protein-histidine pros-kinase